MPALRLYGVPGCNREAVIGASFAVTPGTRAYALCPRHRALLAVDPAILCRRFQELRAATSPPTNTRPRRDDRD
jgi:hypothetical protein